MITLADEQPLPSSLDAERAVLGSILIRNECLYRISNLSAQDFLKDAHRTIFRTMALMAEERMEIEPLTLKEELAKRGLLEAVGGVAYLSSLLDSVPDVANVERYAAIVERMAKKRAGIVAGYEMVRQHMDLETEPEAVTTAAMASLSPLATREDRQSHHIAEVLGDAYAFQEGLARANKSIGLDCGWPTLTDHKVFCSTLVLCTAERGTGKSSLMMAWARGLATNGHPTACISLESGERDLGLRYTSMDTSIPHGYVRDWRTFQAANYSRVAECRRVAAQRPIYLNRRLRTLESIATEIRRLKMMHGIQAAFIDYIQLMTTAKRFERSELGFSHIAQELLALAMELDVMICAFSQVNKGGEVAYAESMEKAARVRLHFDRPHPTDQEKNCQIDFSILKHNEGRTNSFPAHFDEVRQQWNEGTHAQNPHGGTAEPVNQSLFAGKQ